MTERALQSAVLELAALLRWRCYHNRPARTTSGWRTAVEGHGAEGWPDVTLVKGRRLVFAELKSDRGRVSRAQQGWLDDLDAIPGAEVYTWRPADWVSGVVEAVLRGAAA